MSERSFTIVAPPRSTYDRRRLLAQEIEPEQITSVKEITWEHQEAALRAGYTSVRDLLFDEMAEAIRGLQVRVSELEQDAEPTAGEIES